MKGLSYRAGVFAFLGCSLLFACVHSENQAGWRGFPRHFYAEQELLFAGPEGDQRLKAQLQREESRLDLVLLHPLFGMVLVRARAQEGRPLELIYKAPQLAGKELPLAEISSAIQELYAAKNFRELRPGVYQLEIAAGQGRYELSEWRGESACRYPKSIKLTFPDQRFKVQVTTSRFTCQPERGV